jgi:hypothetical protein
MGKMGSKFGDKMKYFILAIVIISVVLLGGCLFAPVKTPTNPNTITITPSTPLDVTAAQLIKAYKDNAVAANKKYLAVEMQVSGIVKEYGTNTSGIPYLLLTVSENDATGVYCIFPDGYDKILPNLKIGQKGGAVGKCRGLEGANVLLDSRD